MVVFKHTGTSFYASRIHCFDQLKKPHEQAGPFDEANISATKTAPICVLIPQTAAAKPEHHKIHPRKHIFMNSGAVTTFTAQQNLNINTNTTGSYRNG